MKSSRVVWTTIRKYYYCGTLIKLAQVTLKCNRLAVEFYLNGIVADTDCNQIFSKRLVPTPSEFWYVLPK